jgi:hypothetical protein
MSTFVYICVFLYIARYQTVHLFFLNLKLDAFFHFVLFVFYFVVMTQSGYYSVAITGSGLKLIAYVIHLVLTVLLIPALFLARFGVMTENRRVMISFQVVQGILSVDFVLMLIDSANGWAFWILAGKNR